MVVVADTSPLIYLSRVGALDLLHVLFGEVVVPRAVWTEVVEQRTAAPGLDALKRAGWLRVVNRDGFPWISGSIPGKPRPSCWLNR